MIQRSRRSEAVATATPTTTEVTAVTTSSSITAATGVTSATVPARAIKATEFTVATTAAASAHFAAGTSFFNDELAAILVCIVQGANCSLCFFVVIHFYESEST